MTISEAKINEVGRNIQANANGITFDTTTSSIVGEASLTVTVVDEGITYQKSFVINVLHLIEDLDISMSLNNNRTITIPFINSGIAPSSVSIVSDNDNILSVSNIQFDVENITCDLTSYNTETDVPITVTIVHNGFTYTKEYIVRIELESIPVYTVENLDTEYGFYLNSNGYYESNNKGIDSSFALCKLNIEAPIDCTMYLDCINYGESGFDFGILSNLDTELIQSSSVDSSNVYKSFSGFNTSNIQTVSYDVTAGSHYIYIKYRKDDYDAEGNDSLQFKVRFE